MDRRQFLAGALASLAGSLLAPMHGSVRDPEARLAGLVGAERSARAVGRAYLAVVPKEADRALLCDRLLRDCPAGPSQSLGADTARLREAFSRRVRRDFAEERVVSLDGWLLSRTEARLCALVALRA